MKKKRLIRTIVIIMVILLECMLATNITYAVWVAPYIFAESGPGSIEGGIPFNVIGHDSIVLCIEHGVGIGYNEKKYKNQPSKVKEGAKLGYAGTYTKTTNDKDSYEVGEEAPGGKSGILQVCYEVGDEISLLDKQKLAYILSSNASATEKQLAVWQYIGTDIGTLPKTPGIVGSPTLDKNENIEVTIDGNVVENGDTQNNVEDGTEDNIEKKPDDFNLYNYQPGLLSADYSDSLNAAELLNDLSSEDLVAHDVGKEEVISKLTQLKDEYKSKAESLEKYPELQEYYKKVETVLDDVIDYENTQENFWSWESIIQTGYVNKSLFSYVKGKVNDAKEFINRLRKPDQTYWNEYFEFIEKIKEILTQTQYENWLDWENLKEYDVDKALEEVKNGNGDNIRQLVQEFYKDVGDQRSYAGDLIRWILNDQLDYEKLIQDIKTSNEIDSSDLMSIYNWCFGAGIDGKYFGLGNRQFYDTRTAVDKAIDKAMIELIEQKNMTKFSSNQDLINYLIVQGYLQSGVAPINEISYQYVEQKPDKLKTDTENLKNYMRPSKYVLQQNEDNLSKKIDENKLNNTDYVNCYLDVIKDYESLNEKLIETTKTKTEARELNEYNVGDYTDQKVKGLMDEYIEKKKSIESNEELDNEEKIEKLEETRIEYFAKTLLNELKAIYDIYNNNTEETNNAELTEAEKEYEEQRKEKIKELNEYYVKLSKEIAKFEVLDESKEEINYTDLMGLCSEIFEFLEENQKYFNAPTMEEIKKSQSLLEEANDYEQFFIAYHSDKNGNKIKDGEEVQLDNSNAEVEVNNEENKYIVGPFKIKYMQTNFSYIDEMVVQCLDLNGKSIGSISLMESNILGENKQYLGHWPNSGDTFYIEFDNSNSIGSMYLDVKLKAIDYCNGEVSELEPIRYRYKEVISKRNEPIDKTYDSDGEADSWYITYETEYVVGDKMSNSSIQKLIKCGQGTRHEKTIYAETFVNKPPIPDDTDWQLRLFKEDADGKSLEGVEFKAAVKNVKTGNTTIYSDLVTDVAGGIRLPVQDANPGDEYEVVITETKKLSGYNPIPTVTLEITIGEGGAITDVMVKEGTSNKSIDEVSISGAKNGEKSEQSYNFYNEDSIVQNTIVNNKNSTKVLTIDLINTKTPPPITPTTPPPPPTGHDDDDDYYSLEMIKISSETEQDDQTNNEENTENNESNNEENTENNESNDEENTENVGKTLNGAKFNVEIKKGEEVLYTANGITTQNGGSAFISGLKLTTTEEEKLHVKLVETEAPQGYASKIESIEFDYTATLNGHEYTIDIDENTINITTDEGQFINGSDNDYIEVEDSNTDDSNPEKPHKNSVQVTIKNEPNPQAIPLRMNLGGLVFRDQAGTKANIEDNIYTPSVDFDINGYREKQNKYTDYLNKIYELQSLLEKGINDDIDKNGIVEKIEGLFGVLDDDVNLKGLLDSIDKPKTENNSETEDETALDELRNLDLENSNSVVKEDILNNIKEKINNIQQYIEDRIENLMGEFYTGDELLDGVCVELYDTENNLIDTTYTIGGHYTFFNLDATKTYYTKFYYDGQKYETMKKQFPEYNSQDWMLTSKATEDARNTYNSKFMNIGAYPANYEVTDMLFDIDKYETDGNNNYYNQLFLEDSEEYQKIFADLKNRIKNYKTQNSNKPIKEVYQKVNTETNNDYYRELQYLYDITISAHTKYEAPIGSLETGAYPVYNNFMIDTEPKNGVPSIYDGQYYINLGLKKRTEFDLSLPEKSLQSAVVTVNGKTETYNFSSVTNPNFTRYLETRLADAQVGMDVELTYKIRLSNDVQSIKTEEDGGAIDGYVTELVDYYTGDYDITDIYVEWQDENLKWHRETNTYVEWQDENNEWQREEKLEGTPNCINLDEPTEEQINDTSYNKRHITFDFEDEKLKLQPGAFKDVYVKMKPSDTEKFKEQLSALTKDNNINMDNLVEINGYTNSQGILDRDSIPGNLVHQINEEGKVEPADWEDDSKMAKLSYIYQEPRTLTGNVWEAAKGVEGDGALTEYLKNDNDKNIEGIEVELVDLDKQQNEEGNIITQEVTAQLFPEVLNDQGQWEIPSDARDENGDIIMSDAKTTTDKNGSYSFAGYIPGNYVVKFTYGDKTYTTYTKSGESETNKTYSGEEYQSVKANSNTLNTLKEDGSIDRYWYANYEKDEQGKEKENPRYSDAYDEVQSRQKEIDFLKTYTYDKASLINSGGEEGYATTSDKYIKEEITYTDESGNTKSVKDALTINAYTAPLELEVEYTTKEVKGSTSKKSQDRKYEVKNIDFGITKRPESGLEISKEIDTVTVKTQTDTLIDHAKIEDIKNGLVPYAKLINSKLYFEIDDEIIQGSTLIVDYIIRATNKGESGTLTYFYDVGGKALAIAYYEEKFDDIIYKDYIKDEEGKVTQEQRKGIGYHNNDGTYQINGYNEDATTVKPITTSVANVVDYIDTNYTFEKDLTLENNKWELVKATDMMDKWITTDTTDTTVREHIQTYQNIVKTTELNIGLVPEGSKYLTWSDENGRKYEDKAETKITLSKKLAPTEDLEFENSVEIVEIENTAGRVDHEATPGNQDPTEEPKERDSNVAEIVNITDPTGQNKSNTWVVITIAVASIFAVGVVLIKKYVVDPRK